MALPQKVIEQLEREPPKTPGWSGQLLIFSSTIFIACLFIYLGLAFGYQSYLRSEVNKLQDQIQVFGQQIPVEEQAKLIDFYSQIANLRSLISNHVISSRAFPWLEKNIQVNAYVSGFSLDVSAGSLIFGVKAKTMTDLLQQLAMFENLQGTEKFNFGGITFGDGSWQFGANIKMPPAYFSYGSGNPMQGK